MVNDKVTDDELDKFVNEELHKDITQEDSIDPSVNEHLGQMGFLWDRTQVKLRTDNVCFNCGSKLIEDNEETKKGQVFVLEATKVDKGVIAFVSICKKCKDAVKIKGEK